MMQIGHHEKEEFFIGQDFKLNQNKLKKPKQTNANTKTKNIDR